MLHVRLITAILIGGALMQPLFAHNENKGPHCQERFLEFEYDIRWQPREEPYYAEEDLGADWPGKREDPFYDSLTR